MFIIPLFPMHPREHQSNFLVSPLPGASTLLAAEMLVQAGALWQGSCRFRVTGFQAHLRWILFLCQGLEALGGPRSSSITRRAAGFPMLFLCIVSGEPPAQARPLLTLCIQTLLALAATALPQDWDQTLDLPQVSVAFLAAGAP